MRRCIFCHQLANSAEDAWPVWLLKEAMKLHQRRKRSMLRFDDDLKQYEFKCATPELRTKSVCDKCNHGWMSNLEDKAKPIILPMLHNKSSHLTESQAQTLATWTLKTAMVFECVNFKNGKKRLPRFYREESLRFKDELLPPHLPRCGTLFWFGQFAGDNKPISHWAYQYHVLNPIDGTPFWHHSAILCINNLVLQVLGFRANVNDHVAAKFVGPAIPDRLRGKSMTPFWPKFERYTRSWPPPDAINDFHALIAVGKRFMVASAAPPLE